MNIDTFIFFTI